jgi:hypothetical protein
MYALAIFNKVYAASIEPQMPTLSEVLLGGNFTLKGKEGHGFIPS